jgi:hypothetical protein
MTSVPELKTRHSMSHPVAAAKASVPRTAFIGVGSLKVAMTIVSAARVEAENASAAVPIMIIFEGRVIGRLLNEIIGLCCILRGRKGPKVICRALAQDTIVWRGLG